MATTYFYITPPIKNQSWEFWCFLDSQANANIFQTGVALMAGDVTVFLDGASQGNIDTLPIEVGATGLLYVQLSAPEMNGDKFTVVKFHDQVGAEWKDRAFLIPIMQAVTVSDFDEATDAVTPADGSITAAKIAANAIGASEIADGAIDAGAIATGAIDADAIADNAITAAKIAADAIGASEIADGAIDAGAIASNAITAAKIATDAVDADALAADAVAEIWSYSSRTLTQSAASVAAAVSGSTITLNRGDTLSAALTGLGSLSGYVSLDFTVKYAKGDSDDDAVMRIRKNASGTGDGLLRFNGAATTGRETNGSITIDDADAGNITIALAAAESDDLGAGSYYYDIQMITASAVSTKSEGTFTVTEDVTRLIT